MCLIASGAKDWQSGMASSGKRNAGEEDSTGYLPENFSREAGRDEDDARIENVLTFYRQVDAEDFVFAERESLSTRGIAPPRRKRFPANAHQNSAQP